MIVRKVSVLLRFLCIARRGIGYDIRPVPAPFWIFGVFTVYLLSAGLDTGVAFATIIIYFALSYQGIKVVWWGNTVNSTTFDGKSVPWKRVAKGAFFGPGPGEF
ncbi:hypothetical protein DFH08DRAFT_825992 [Mycena albidolilacea]|uniref:Uncharacterized protein n=1 Tax=Mycena albidolilacea TaxID=1033008 RepID=A0AAD7E9E7_9AGAR|nr:hypothetical protein DFH08DRAFT_825992 [Mycena albidolilacea]